MGCRFITELLKQEVWDSGQETILVMRKLSEKFQSTLLKSELTYFVSGLNGSITAFSLYIAYKIQC